MIYQFSNLHELIKKNQGHDKESCGDVFEMSGPMFKCKKKKQLKKGTNDQS